MMKLLYSHRTRSADGQLVHIASLTQALAARGVGVIMGGPKDGHSSASPRTMDASAGRGLKDLLPAPVYECAEYGYSFSAYRRLAALNQAHQPDVLYERYNLFYHSGVWLSRRARLPMILEVNAPLASERAIHGDLALKSFARKSEAAIWRAADMVLPVTNVLADEVRAVGVSNDKIAVIHNGVSEDFLAPHEPSPMRERYELAGKLVLGFAGFVRDWHGVDRVIRFIAEAKRDDLHLLIVGDGTAREGLEALASELGVRDQLTITGVVQREDMPAHVAAFDIALQPAVVAYASPLKLFEYMALGKPIIAPAAANIKEVLADGEDGLLFAEGDFARALGVLVGDAELRTRLGAAARDSLMRQGFTWAQNAGRVEAIAERLMEAR